MLVDSTVFIDYLRGRKKAKEFLENPKESLSTSVIVVMEIIAGLKKGEGKKFLLFLQQLNIEVVHLSFSISKLALELFQELHPRGLGIADSLIAATVLSRSQKLATHNIKHFSFIKRLKVVIPY